MLSSSTKLSAAASILTYYRIAHIHNFNGETRQRWKEEWQRKRSRTNDEGAHATVESLLRLKRANFIIVVTCLYRTFYFFCSRSAEKPLTTSFSTSTSSSSFDINKQCISSTQKKLKCELDFSLLSLCFRFFERINYRDIILASINFNLQYLLTMLWRRSSVANSRTVKKQLTKAIQWFFDEDDDCEHSPEGRETSSSKIPILQSSHVECGQHQRQRMDCMCGWAHTTRKMRKKWTAQENRKISDLFSPLSPPFSLACSVKAGSITLN